MNTEKVHKEWLQLGERHSNDVQLLDTLWKNILKKYSEKNRYYHNLNHISSMLKQAEENKSDIIDLDVVLYAIWFHDIVYKSTKKDNEDKSAKYAEKVLKKLYLGNNRIERVGEFIISTKKHQVLINENEDNAFLLDFDLAILGQPWAVYSKYIESIRKEYRLFPDFIYIPERKKVLQAFLSRDVIYFTEKYRVLYEQSARENLEKEIKLLP